MSTVTVTVTYPSGTGTSVITAHDRTDAGNMATYILRRPGTVRIRRQRPRR